jgi:ribosomal protein S18 acetylase RimI-like enzyme
MIRPICSADAETVSEVLRQALVDGGHTTPARLVEGSTDPLFVGLVQEATTGIVGALIGSVVADEAEIHEIAVARSHRRGGHGRALVQAFLMEAGRRGAKLCFLEVRSANHAAVGLYSSLGFEACGERKGYYRDGTNAVLMRYCLGSEA